MRLDVQTLFWILNLSYAASILFAIVLYRLAGAFPGGKLWILAQALVAAGSLLFVERGRIPYALLATGNLTMVAGAICYAHASWGYRRTRPFPRMAYAAVPLVAIALLILGGSPVNFRNSAVSLALGAFGAWTAAILLRGIDRRYRYAAAITALPFALTTAAGAVQIVLSMTSRPVYRFEELGEGHAIVYLLAIATASTSLLGFFLLATQRRQFALERQGEELAAANLRLREADRVKDLFVSMLAHDLRGPISGSARYARKHLIPDEVDLRAKRQALLVLASSLEKATELLDNVLLWSRNRQEAHPTSIDEIDLAETAKSLVELFEPAFDEKGLRVLERLVETPLRTERESVELIVRNMLSNAIKFSPVGGEVEVEAARGADGGPFVAVADRVSCIEPEIRRRLFRIDSRVTAPGTMGETGTGLGLILCAEYAARIGASFEVGERPGGGCVSRLGFEPAGSGDSRGPAG